ncbi:MAG: UDP-glucose/GDP-mannose dehydrogenase family protein [Candidatus Sungbacteria bacterium]|uniref:UDP-glucose 6-dehydrogenase n=1 Tax=Candidatus Sungiibacteriota bacterium TaxID=2750080 RepID=A0A932YVV8_9BACT|nr:UDP-glucose/GDP-mannose dehydrogenase family protein [Candidatus Sungbacteria bacterium]
MKTAVVGSWHLASVYAVGLGTLGHEVRLVAPPEVSAGYETGKPPVFEPGLEEGIQNLRRAGRLSFSSDIHDPANAVEVCFIAEDCKVSASGVDLAAFQSLFDEVAGAHPWKVLAISSQLPLGTCREFSRAYPGIAITYFPEFLRLGTALERFLKPDFIVVGGSEPSAQAVLEFFSAIQCPKFAVSLEEAEMSKHAANAFVATTVSFISELTKFSERYNVDLEKIGEILRHDKRIGPKAYVMPGMGFSGETVERDIRVLLDLSRRNGFDLPMLREVINVNNEHNGFIEKKLAERMPEVRGKRIGFLGATYRPFTSTLRGSLFLPLMEKLAAAGAAVALWDPNIESSPFAKPSAKEVFDGADAVVIAVSKPAFRELDFASLVGRMRGRILIDAANLLDRERVKALAVDYASIGRGRMP